MCFLQVTTLLPERYSQDMTMKWCVFLSAQSSDWLLVEPKVSVIYLITWNQANTQQQFAIAKLTLFSLFRGPVPRPHHHRRLVEGTGGSRALHAASPHLSVQRGSLHHLLRERSFLQLQHKWQTAGANGSQWFLSSKAAVYADDVNELKLFTRSPHLLYLCRTSPQAILLSSDGQNLVTGGDNGVVEVWQACDFKQLYIYPGCDAGIRAMDLSHDQRYIIMQGG